MNTFTWELVTHLIALYIVKCQSPESSGYSDCTSAILCTTVALRTTLNCLPYTTAGLWSLGVHNFASAIHLPKDAFYWAAARCALIVYDWLEHGRNIVKMHEPGTIQHTTAGQCTHCLQPDSQAHCTLHCKYDIYTPFQKIT
jgi:hypothetical protein